MCLCLSAVTAVDSTAPKLYQKPASNQLHDNWNSNKAAAAKRAENKCRVKQQVVLICWYDKSPDGALPKWLLLQDVKTHPTVDLTKHLDVLDRLGLQLTSEIEVYSAGHWPEVVGSWVFTLKKLEEAILIKHEGFVQYPGLYDYIPPPSSSTLPGILTPRPRKHSVSQAEGLESVCHIHTAADPLHLDPSYLAPSPPSLEWCPLSSPGPLGRIMTSQRLPQRPLKGLFLDGIDFQQGTIDLTGSPELTGPSLSIQIPHLLSLPPLSLSPYFPSPSGLLDRDKLNDLWEQGRVYVPRDALGAWPDGI
ncbi:hypothetical protein OE88DRAFT_1647316 [Heliocybe sulcata]|uniref:Uncharacterized protein n=1 Tax=Heliocybe sulcata TaxID=5364 RepID=A0A5C3MTX2_9AGAM|nr:hypothetical protein OE88DRAFT_1647316 [Heliocybe sulcata]